MKKKTKFLIIILSIVVSVPSFSLIGFISYLIIASNIQRKVHNPSLLHQTRYVLEKDGGIIYLDSLESFMRSSLNRTYEPHYFFHNDIRLMSTGNNSITYSEKYVAFSGRVSSYNDSTSYIQVYDADFSLIKEFANEGYYDAIFYDNFLYYSNFNNQLVKYDIENNSTIIVANDLKPTLSYYDSSYSFDIGMYNEFTNCLFNGKAFLSHYYVDGNLHLYCKNFDLCIKRNRLSINDIEDENKNYFFDRLYDNAYLIDDKIVFAAYCRLENDECGSQSDLCICRLGKSYLFAFDIKTQEMSLIKEFADGTFLIDYDLENAHYYYQSAFYTNNVFVRESKRIEPGELKTIKGEKYLPRGTGVPYYLSYCNGKFYGA